MIMCVESIPSYIDLWSNSHSFVMKCTWFKCRRIWMCHIILCNQYLQSVKVMKINWINTLLYVGCMQILDYYCGWYTTIHHLMITAQWNFLFVIKRFSDNIDLYLPWNIWHSIWDMYSKLLAVRDFCYKMVITGISTTAYIGFMLAHTVTYIWLWITP